MVLIASVPGHCLSFTFYITLYVKALTTKLNFLFLFDFTAASVVPYGDRKMSHLTSIAHIIIYSTLSAQVEISGDVLYSEVIIK